MDIAEVKLYIFPLYSAPPGSVLSPKPLVLPCHPGICLPHVHNSFGFPPSKKRSSGWLLLVPMVSYGSIVLVYCTRYMLFLHHEPCSSVPSFLAATSQPWPIQGGLPSGHGSMLHELLERRQHRRELNEKFMAEIELRQAASHTSTVSVPDWQL